MGKRPSHGANTTHAADKKPAARAPLEEALAQIAALNERKPTWSKLQGKLRDPSPRTVELLRQAADGVRRGDREFVRRMRFGGVGRRAAGLGANNTWLPANRFDWWDFWDSQRNPTIDQFLTGHLSGHDPLTVLTNEFSSPLAVVAGSDLNLLHMLPGDPFSDQLTMLPWDGPNVQDGDSPNGISGAGFVAHGLFPQSRTALVRLPVGDLGGGSRDTWVLFNDQGASRTDIPQSSSLFIDFIVPQRAVALEYGFVGPAPIDPSSVSLIAFNRNGDSIAVASGRDILPIDPNNPQAPPQLQPLAINLIGLRAVDPNNPAVAISRVELRFMLASDPGPRGFFQPQVVHRIWYEALAPAAVKQGKSAWEYYPDPPKPGDNRIGPPPLRDDEKGPVKLNLPYHCDRAAVFIRGFKLTFLDERQRDIAGLAAGVSTQLFSVAPGGQITFWPIGGFRVVQGNTPGIGDAVLTIPNRVQVYYTVLAWDSTQMDLTAVPVDAGDSISDAPYEITIPLNQAPAQDYTVQVDDPCNASFLGVDADTACGPLFGGLSSFACTAYGGPLPWRGPTPPVNQPLDKFYLAVGRVGETTGDCLIEEEDDFGFIPTGLIHPPPLSRAKGKIDWELCTMFSAGGEPAQTYLRRFQGTLLTGHSVMPLGPYYLALNWGAVTTRVNPEDFEFSESEPIDGDMAFVALGLFYAKPQGPIRELEIEVLGQQFDGHQLTFAIAYGVGVEPIGGGGFSDDGPLARLAVGFPVWSALVRKTRVPNMRVSAQDLLFDHGVIGLAQQVPDQYGLLRNDGNLPLTVTGATFGGPNFEEFVYWLHYRGAVFYDFASQPPVQLDPTESLVITGWFIAQADAPPGQPARTAFLDFQTNSVQNPIVRVQLLGHTQPSDAHGSFLPTQVDFGAVHVGQSAQRNAIIVNDGTTPLFVSGLRVVDETLGCRILGTEGGAVGLTLGGVNGAQLNPGAILTIHLAFTPVQQGVARTQLVADTNDTDPGNRHLSATLVGLGT